VAEAKPSLAIKRGESGPLAIAGPNTNAHTSSLVTPQIQDQLGLLISQVNSLLSAQAQQKGLKSVFLSQINLDNNTWIIDSGATNHMTNYKSHLLNLKTYDTSQYVSVANGTKIPIQGQDTVKIFDRNISNVLYIPGLPTNLLSVQKLIQDLNCNVIFHSNRVVFQDKITGKKIGEGLERNGLYVINYPNHALQISNKESSNLLHWRLGHPSNKVLNNLFTFSKLDFDNCDVCRFLKQTRLPFSLSQTKSEKPFDLVHSDVWTAPIDSYNGFKYYVIFIDDFSRTTWLYLLKAKSDVYSCFEEFFNYVINQYNANIKNFRSDNGTEFINKQFSEFFKQKGILHQTSCIYTPEQNGVSERKNCHILEVTRSLLFQSNVLKSFWSDAILTVIYLINRLPTPVLENQSPLETLNKRKMSLNHLKNFGCTSFVHIKRTDKLDKNAVKTIF
jgi:Integrase core domain/GAG-pre-integrase domain